MVKKMMNSTKSSKDQSTKKAGKTTVNSTISNGKVKKVSTKSAIKTPLKSTKSTKRHVTLESVISRIRDILRLIGITGMSSINHCIMFVISRYLDDDTCDKIGISNIYSYDNIMLDDDKEVDAEILLERFCVKYDGEEPFLKIIVEDIKFTNITFGMEKNSRQLKEIMVLLKDINIHKLNEKFDIIGTIYELHLKTGSTNSMRDLGQYFTHRLVIKYMIELCDPKMDEKTGNIETIVDPTMGTGGFLTMAMKHLNHKYESIDWSKNKSRVYGFDIDENVRNMASLNCMIEVGEFFDDTLYKEDTLRHGMRLEKGELKKVDIILANEPMGLKGLKYDDCCQRVKDLKISGTKAEPLFMQLFMQSLNDGGRCAVVVPDGVLFNEAKLFKDTRKYLVENFNLKKVTALDGDFFLNTGVKTSIMFFEKNGKTKEVEFCKISLKDDDVQEDVITKANIDKIVNEKYSLFVNRYNEQDNIKLTGLKYDSILTITNITSGKPVNKDNRMGTKYPYYSSNGINGYIDEYLYDGEYLITAQDGSIGAHHYVNGKFYPSNHVWIMQSINKSVITKYIYYYLQTVDLKQYVTGSVIPKITKDNLGKIKIPIPPLEVQNAIVERLDLLSENIKTMEKNIEEFENIRNAYMDINLVISHKHKTMCIGDIFEMKIGKETTNKMKNIGNYDFYNGSASSPVGKIDTYSYDNDDNYILLIKDGGAGQGKYGKNIGLGKVFLVSGKTAFTTSVVALSVKNKISNVTYLYHYMSFIKNNLMDLARYTTGLGHLTTTRLKDIKIPIPPLEKQKEIVTYCDNIQNIIDQLEKQIENNKQLMKDIMDGYLKQCSESSETEDKSKSQVTTNIVIKKSPKVTKQKKITKIYSEEFERSNASEEDSDQEFRDEERNMEESSEDSEDPFEQPRKIIKPSKNVATKKDSTNSSISSAKLPGTKRKPSPKFKAVARKVKK